MTKLTLYHGDCLKVLPTLPDNSIDLVLTDPPYNLATEKMFMFKSGKASNSQKLMNHYDNFGTNDNYYLFLDKIMNELYRVLKPNRVAVVYISYKHIHNLINAGLSAGFTYRRLIILNKTNPHPVLSDKIFRPSFEPAVIFVKGDKPDVFNFQGQSNMRDVFTANTSQRDTEHPNEKPFNMIKWLVKIYSNKGDTILDPFLGSGTTMLAGLSQNRNVIGIELDANYIKLIKERLHWGNSLNPDVEFEFKEVIL